MMEALKRYVMLNFEQAFVLTILISVVVLYYFLPHKLAFLDFYFLPVLTAAYYLDSHRAVLGAIFCILIVSIYALLYPLTFHVVPSPMDLALSIIVWGSFLVLTGALVSNLKLKLKEETLTKRLIEGELTDSREALEDTAKQLTEHKEHFEAKVMERTVHLEKAKEVVENLKEKVEEALYNTMDPTVVKLIIEKRLRTDKRIISVLFSDLKSFTEFSEEHKPEIVVTQLNAFFAEMETVLLNYGAHIDKYMGDGIMAEFGAPLDHARHALMAVTAALRMQQIVMDNQFPLQMRIGIATGEAIIGLIGQKRQTYTALGDVVNVASRIEQLCKPGGVTVDEATYESVKQYFRARIITATPLNRLGDNQLGKRISTCFEKLSVSPDDPSLIREMGFLFREAKDFVQAHHYLRRALSLLPDDEVLKLAFAECSVKMDQEQDINIRGKKIKLRLYEITGLKDPLQKEESIPRHLYDRYRNEVDSLLEYPAEIIHPVEVIDGTLGHSRVVGFLSYAIADALHLSDKDKQDVLLAGYFCDIGKTIIPHHILNQAGTITDKELEELIKHPREGIRVLKKMGYENENLFQMIINHHENFHGGGYPAGLSGDQIPLGARIVAIADTYDALTSWRPFRNCWDCEAAYAEMERSMARGKFDPALMPVFGKLLRDG